MRINNLPRLPKKMARILAVGSAGAFVFLAGSIVYKAYYYLRPTRYPIKKTPKDLGFSYENVKFNSTDGIPLCGWFVSREPKRGGFSLKRTVSSLGQPTIVLCHGYPANRAQLLDIVPLLVSKYNLFLFDFRGLGESGGAYTTLGYKEPEDLIGAVNFLKKREEVNPSRIGVLGFSMGGAVGLMAAKKSFDIKAVVADSPYASLDRVMGLVAFKKFGPLERIMVHLSCFLANKLVNINIKEVCPQEAVKNLKTPILIIHGRKDKRVGFKESEIIYRNAILPKEFWAVSGDGHGMIWQEKKEEYQKKILDFFGKYL